ncbi:molecular chaperone [Aeromonas jandaei]|uniref:fimbrial biogenesis chaperone n=2 Tax=Aeromonas jandaei TaxID=650 RepID=UPI002B052632|nr:molecular chaperone [Aeromonas jandaei]
MRGILITAFFFTSGLSHAATILDTTRVIYNEHDKSKTFNVKNMGSSDSLMRVWIDTGDKESTSDSENLSFLVQPALFKISSNASQVARIIKLTKKLPKDRESIFYINAIEMPAVEKSLNKQNKLVLITKSRIKLFYRPDSIKVISTDELKSSLNVRVHKYHDGYYLIIENPTPVHASIFNGSLIVNNRKYEVPIEMIPPFATKKWPINNYVQEGSKSGVVFNYTLVNDYGGYVRVEKSLGE